MQETIVHAGLYTTYAILLRHGISSVSGIQLLRGSADFWITLVSSFGLAGSSTDISRVLIFW
jgi:hypothetical protein